ncbi:stage V sporulation protein D [Spirochaetota bacterium]|nr:stage V sporulation protein D [Spirochaetota bacterium]
MNKIKINIFIIFLIIGFSTLLSRSFYLTLGEKSFNGALNNDKNTLNQAESPSSPDTALTSNEPSDTLSKQLETDLKQAGDKTTETTAKTSTQKYTLTNKRPSNYALLPTTQRGTIMDMSGFPLAYSEYLYNLYLDGRVKAPLNRSSVERIAELINTDPKTLHDNLYQNRVVLLKRFAEKDTAKWLYNLKTEHFLIDRVLHRTYPENTLLAQTLGFIGHDEHGLSGLEQYYEKELSSFIGSKAGEELRLKLAIDKHLQYNIAAKLKKKVIEKQAQAGIVIVQDIKTRSIRALNIYPTFNLNHFTQTDAKSFRNNAISYIIEPGSIFKVPFVAYLLEQYKDLDINDKRYYCNGFYELKNGEIINCTGKHGAVSLSDIISYSCNAGMIQAAEVFSKKNIYNFLTQLEIGRPTGIDLPGEEHGILPPLKEWGQRTVATSLIGQGIGVTPLQLINTFSMVVSDGFLYQPKLATHFQYYQDHKPLRETKTPTSPRRKVLQSSTTAKIRQLLKHGVRADSTGAAAKKGGYLKVLGKTSTSQVANNRIGGYHIDKYHSIFAGAYPETNPQFTVLVVFISPKKEYHGGRTAAPLFADILDDVILSYRLDDERTYETIALPASYPSVPSTHHTDALSFDKNTLHAAEISPENTTIDNSLRTIPIPDSNPNSITHADSFTFDKGHRKHPSLAHSKSIHKFSTRSVPSFKGMSMRTTIKVMDKLVLENSQRDYHVSYQLSGSGYVIHQEPPPQTSIRGDTVIKLFFGH